MLKIEEPEYHFNTISKENKRRVLPKEELTKEFKILKKFLSNEVVSKISLVLERKVSIFTLNTFCGAFQEQSFTRELVNYGIVMYTKKFAKEVLEGKQEQYILRCDSKIGLLKIYLKYSNQKICLLEIDLTDLARNRNMPQIMIKRFEASVSEYLDDLKICKKNLENRTDAGTKVYYNGDISKNSSYMDRLLSEGSSNLTENKQKVKRLQERVDLIGEEGINIINEFASKYMEYMQIDFKMSYPKAIKSNYTWCNIIIEDISEINLL